MWFFGFLLLLMQKKKQSVIKQIKMIAVATSGHRPDDERIYHKEIKSLINAGYEILYCTRWDEHMDFSGENLKHFNTPEKKHQ